MRKLETQFEDENHSRKELQNKRDTLRERLDKMDRETSELTDERRAMQKEINGTGKKKLSKRQLQESILRLSCNTCSTLAKIRGRPTPAMTAPTLGRKKETVPSATGRLNAMRIGTPACPPGGGITSTDFQMPRSPPVPPVGVRIDIQPSWRKSMSR